MYKLKPGSLDNGNYVSNYAIWRAKFIMSTFNAAKLFSVQDMVFVVTGGGSGLGKWMAEALDANGAAKVFILGRRLELLRDVASNAVSAFDLSI